MGVVIPFRIHRRLSGMRTPKTRGSIRRSKASDITNDSSAGIRPRNFQLETACAETFATLAAAEVPPNSEITSSTDVSMEPEYTRPVYSSSINEPEIDHFLPQVDNRAMDWPAIKQRLKDAAVAARLNDSKFAGSIGLSPQAWFNIHGGPNKLDPAIAVEMRRVHGFSLDWIYCGDLSQLSADLKGRLLEIERKRQAPPKRARK